MDLTRRFTGLKLRIEAARMNGENSMDMDLVALDSLLERIAALEQREKALRKALTQAAMSLETIAEQAGKDEYLKHISQVRGYAHRRAGVARAALSAPAAPPK